MKKLPKKTKSRAPALDVSAVRLDADALAAMIGVTPRRVNQLKAEANLKPGADGLYSAVDFLKAAYLYDSPRGEALRARTRQANARALETEQRVRREQRWLLTLAEVRELAEMLFESAIESVQADSSRFYSEYHQTHDEMESRAMTHRLYAPLRGLAVAWSNGVIELINAIESDHLPNGKRLDEVLSNLIHELTAAQMADEKTRNANQGT
jgi:hypothetical protein